MKSLREKRFVFEQNQPGPELQVQPPVEAAKESAPQTAELLKEKPAATPESISAEYKEKGKQSLVSAGNKLTIFENLKVG